MKPGSLILVEFNELCPAMLTRFMDEGALPTFQKFFNSAEIFTTEAGELPPNLEPWIQWITVHTGLRLKDHGVFHLGDAAKMRSNWLWDHVSNAGGTNWICGSMNAAYGPDFRGLFLPDPWTSQVKPNTADLLAYQRFVRGQVQEHTRTKPPTSLKEAFSFLLTMFKSGLSLSTIAFVGKQMIHERLANVRWRRAAILDRLQLDLFCHFYRRLRPNFATFFSNSTAHYQHVYWRFMDPTLFSIKPTEKERREFGEAIRWGYVEMDRMLARILRSVQSDTTVVFATALSQQPCQIYESDGGKRFYRPLDRVRLLEFAGIAPGTFSVEPVMSEEFFVRFKRQDEAMDAHRKLMALSVGGRSAFKARHEGNAVFTGCSIFNALPSDATLAGESGTRSFFDLMYSVDVLKSGMHHPDGALWIRRPNSSHRVHPAPVPLERVAPTLLTFLTLPIPADLPQSLL